MGEEEEGELLSLFKKNTKEAIGIALADWKGQLRIDIRTYVQAIGEDAIVPTKKGISIPANLYPELAAAVEELGQVMSPEKLVACISKSPSEEIRIGTNVFKGTHLIYIRTFVRGGKEGAEPFPTAKGISMGVHLYPKLLEAIREVAKHLPLEEGGPEAGSSGGYRAKIHGQLEEMLSDEGEDPPDVRGFIGKLACACPRSTQLSNAEFLEALRQARSGGLSIAAATEAINHYRRRRVRVMSIRRIPRRRSRRPAASRHRQQYAKASAPAARGVDAKVLGRCEHGVSKFFICAICEPQRFREWYGT